MHVFKILLLPEVYLETLKTLVICSLILQEGPEGVKLELGLADLTWENWVQATLGLGFGRWEWEKTVKNQKWERDLRIAKCGLEKK